MNWQGPLQLHQSGLLVLEKLVRPDRGGMEAVGMFWQPPLSFMPLQAPILAVLPTSKPSSRLPAGSLRTGTRVWRLPGSHPLPRLLEEPACAWFLQGHCPGIQ
uniref:Uncharacterized protein n=1 Tax=Thermogemmatispora argillosa TaxID=2045280 RepID=A0A455SZ80_9CHLR|nr:hypothetical protein KTA_04010 [Thermogemmatispora argillosa]